MHIYICIVASYIIINFAINTQTLIGQRTLPSTLNPLAFPLLILSLGLVRKSTQTLNPIRQ